MRLEKGGLIFDPPPPAASGGRATAMGARFRYRGSLLLRRVETAGDVLTVTQRLWRTELTRGELEVALELLGSRPPGTGAVGFSEELRRYYSGGPQVQPTCSRTPNVCAVVLVDLGLLTA